MKSLKHNIEIGDIILFKEINLNDGIGYVLNKLPNDSIIVWDSYYNVEEEWDEDFLMEFYKIIKCKSISTRKKK